ncbi:MAG: ATP-dependent DNA ligase [Gemmataceae bacterium]
MSLPVKLSLPPMEALLVDRIPDGSGWQYEPKWDGFRCLAFRDGDKVTLQSKAGRPLTRYFPEVAEMLAALPVKRFVIDGELVVPVDGSLSFDDLLMRIHPAASRIQKLAAATPASLVVFDMLADDRGQSLVELALSERRAALEKCVVRATARAKAKTQPASTLVLSPATTSLRVAERWLKSGGGALDGVVAKKIDDKYHAGERTMIKVKRIRTADCVVGGFRYGTKSKTVGSLLLGLYDDEGLLHHVGFTSSLVAEVREQLTTKLEKLRQPPGFTGRAPGGPSRWSTERSTQWEPLAPKLVVEVQFDHVSGGRFRHGTKFLRWRPDKAPKQCTMEQLESTAHNMWKLLQKSRRTVA